jgi:diaminopimelate decarboxylase
MHIGSQITEVTPFEQAVRKVLPLAQRLQAAYGLEFLSIGGGLGIIYEPALASASGGWWNSARAKKILTPQKYAARLLPLLKETGVRILLEPGRFISGNAGVLLTRVEYIKRTGTKHFLIVDAAMNDLIRPAFYDAYHEIVPTQRKNGTLMRSDVVGPICESGDFFCHDRPLPKVEPGDYLALMSAGAYGSVMGSNYNTRALPAEVLVNGKRAALVRARQPIEAIWRQEKLAPWLA